jgi:hypothetical protein
MAVDCQDWLWRSEVALPLAGPPGDQPLATFDPLGGEWIAVLANANWVAERECIPRGSRRTRIPGSALRQLCHGLPCLPRRETLLVVGLGDV